MAQGIGSRLRSLFDPRSLAPVTSLSDRLAWRRRLVAPLRGHVLEIGCGSGSNFRHYDASCRVRAIEPDAMRIRQAREVIPQASACIQLYRARAEQLPFPDGTFDAVFSCLVLCSVTDQTEALSEIRRVLRSDGFLALLEHVLPTTKGLTWLAHKTTPWWSARLHNCHLNRDTVGALMRQGWRVSALKRRACVIRGEFVPAADGSG